VTSRRLPLVLLLVYVGFVAYGSFSPFDFAYDPDRIRRFLDHPPPRLHDADGRRLVSLPDVVSNVLLGVPFGVLMAWSGMAGGPLATRVLRLVLADTATAGAVEGGQLFAPSRTSSLPDVVAQVAGALAGLLVAHALSGAAPRPLDVSTVWHNVGSAQWRPLGGLRDAFWPDLLVEKVLPWAVLGGLVRVVLAGMAAEPARASAWLTVTAAARLAYEELTPFSVLRSAAAARARVARVEWLPFASCCLADPRSALFDAARSSCWSWC